MLSTFPIFWLTVRQFAAGRATRVVAFFAATPIVFALIYLINAGNTTGNVFLGDVFNQFLAPTIVPLATLILATATLGNELSDRTIVYLVIKPVSTWRIVLEKFIGTFVVTSAAFIIGVFVTWLVVMLGPDTPKSSALPALLIASLIGVAAYGSVFLFISLIIPRALLVGVIYILLWESLLARFIPGIRVLSIRHFIQSVFVHMLKDPSVTIAQATQLGSALIVLVVIVIASLVFAALRLKQMNLD
ncbi:MAG TPA: ABC transporter permease subunit [Nitrolancea sp.]|jgi:ABC-2 type transport system permease protein|nr:ABC transporter permease subunit [Nitrolancea sp.]